MTLTDTAIWLSDETATEHALALAKRWSLPLIAEQNELYSFLLQCSEQGLALICRELPHIKPFRLDFNTGPLSHRLAQIGRKQPLAKAIGIKPHTSLKIVDATAGLGRDSVSLACLGCEVTSIERSLLVGIILEDALRRMRTPIKKPSLQIMEATEFLNKLDPSHNPDVIYYDPMFPARSKTALVKKEMQLLHLILGHSKESDEEAFLELARDCAQKRVVVKRPKWALPIKGHPPSQQLSTPQLRFDIYLKR